MKLKLVSTSCVAALLTQLAVFPAMADSETIRNFNNVAAGKIGRINSHGYIFNSAGGKIRSIQSNGYVFNSAGGKIESIESGGYVYNSAGGEIGDMQSAGYAPGINRNIASTSTRSPSARDEFDLAQEAFLKMQSMTRAEAHKPATIQALLERLIKGPV